MRPSNKHASVLSKLLLLFAAVGCGGMNSPAQAAEQLIQPVGITQLAGDTIDPIAALINGAGLTEPATLANYLTLVHGGGADRWVTGTGTWPDNYYVAGAVAPEFEFALGGSFKLSDLVIWGYSGNNNEGTDFFVEFSSDNGATYSKSVQVASPTLLGSGAGRLPFGATYEANRVRVTITDNAGHRGFSGEGPGDRVGLGELRFIGSPVEGQAVPPTLSLQPMSQRGLEGLTTAFQIKAGGTEPLSYQWQFNGANIEGANQATLTLNPVQTANAGKYRVVVTNTAGILNSDEATLVVFAAAQPGQVVVTPTAVALLAGDTLAGFPVEGLINGEGLLEPVTIDNYFTNTHTNSGRWVTATGTWPANYYAGGGVTPQFEFTLDATYTLNDMVVWGYDNNNEGTDFLVEFSSDAGVTYSRSVTVASPFRAGWESMRLPFGGSFEANRVRVTITNNGGGRSFDGAGGDRVALSEVRFITKGTGEPAAQLIQPTGITQLAGDSIDSITALINGSGLTEPATLANYMALVHGGGADRWVTSTGTWPDNYYVAGAVPPQFEFALGGFFALTDLVIWGYSGNNNEGTDFKVEFSSDNGATYSKSVQVASPALLGSGAGRLPFGAAYEANRVRVTITDNAGHRGFPGEGPGDRVGLGEVRFIGTVVEGQAVPPSIALQPASHRALGGLSTSFQAKAGGTEPLHYQWQFNGVNIAGANQATLTLNPVRTADAGKYRVVVTNTAGVLNSDEAILVVFAAAQPGQVVVTPTAVALLAGDTLAGFPVEGLINGEGLLEPVTIDNYFATTHTNSGRWVTATGTWPANYYTAGSAAPQFEFTLDATYSLNDMLVWGYDNNNEGTDFLVEFSSDAGVTYSRSVTVASPFRTGWESMRLPFGGSFDANHVRVTITNNGGGRSFEGAGGDRVALSEVRFITKATVQPVLSIATSAGKVSVSWPTGTTGFTLQSTLQLANPSWTPVEGVANNQVVITPSGAGQFFRLVKP